MNDKYIELKEGLINNSVVFSQRPSQIGQSQIFPEQFAKLEQEIQQSFQQIRENNDYILQIIKKQDNLVISADQQSAYALLSNYVYSNEKYHIEVKNKLENLNKLVQSAKQNDPDEPETRAQENIQINLQNQLFHLFKETSKIQQKYKSKMTKKINRQIDMIDKNISQEERDKIIENPAVLFDINIYFKKGLQTLIGVKMKIKPSRELTYAIEDIQDKYKGIVNLEKSIARIAKLFEDISMFIDIQQEEIDNIEINVNKGKNYVMKAEKIFIQEKKEHQTRRKKMCCIILLGLFLLGLIMFPILYKTGVF